MGSGVSSTSPGQTSSSDLPHHPHHSSSSHQHGHGKNPPIEVSVFILYPEILQYKEQLNMLKFTDGDITKLYRLYRKLCPKDSDEVPVLRLLEFCSLRDSPFMTKYFHLLQNVSNNYQNFFDFTLTLWHYCTIATHHACLIFDLYDLEGVRQLDGLVADQMIKELYGKKFDKSRTALELIVRMQRQSPKVVNRYFFLEFVYANHTLLQPCQTYRRKITDVILGKLAWDRLEQERVILTRGSYYHLRDVISMTDQYAQLIKFQTQKDLILTGPDGKHLQAPAMTVTTVRASTAPESGKHGRRNRTKAVGYQTAEITLGNRTLKPIIQKGEYDESIQMVIKPVAPNRAPKRIERLTCYNYLASS